jgi:hypothetical protein
VLVQRGQESGDTNNWSSAPPPPLLALPPQPPPSSQSEHDNEDVDNDEDVGAFDLELDG